MKKLTKNQMILMVLMTFLLIICLCSFFFFTELDQAHNRTGLPLLGANTAGNFNLKPMLIYHSENPSFTVFFFIHMYI